MAGISDEIDIELLIGEVKNYPEIWNVAAETYHDRTKKRGAWITICQVLCEGFDDKNDKEKNEICMYIYYFLVILLNTFCIYDRYLKQ